MAIKGFSVLPKTLKLEMVSCHIRTLIEEGCLTLLLRCSWCIIQPQPTGLNNFLVNNFQESSIVLIQIFIYPKKNFDNSKYYFKKSNVVV